MEGAFRHFGGVPEEVLLDNARALVAHHDPQTREVQFNERLRAFAGYWGFRPRACAPCRARTKGKDERMVGYVKGNALAGRRFASWAALATHLDGWLREVGDVRVHAGTGERPRDRFVAEAAALRPLPERPPFQVGRSLLRRVHSDACIEIDSNRHERPVAADRRRGAGGSERGGGAHPARGDRSGRSPGAGGTARSRAGAGVVAAAQGVSAPAGAPAVPAPPALLRPLSEYAELAGGTW